MWGDAPGRFLSCVVVVWSTHRAGWVPRVYTERSGKPWVVVVVVVVVVVFVVVVVVVFTLNRPFYPASSVHPVSVLIPSPREILILWSQTDCETEEDQE